MIPVDYAGEPKLNVVRSIPAAPSQPAFVPKNPRLRNRAKETLQNAESKPAAAAAESTSVTRRTAELKSRSTTTPRRRGAAAASSTSSSTAVPVTQKAIESGANRFRPTRKSATSPLPTISKSRRPFATRSTTESAPIVTSLTTKAPLASQRAPLTRGSFRQAEKPRQSAAKDGLIDSSEEENYPEHFKALLKNKANANPTQTINESEKKLLLPRKATTVKYYRQSPVTTISTPTATEARSSLRTTTTRVARSTTASTAAKTEKKFQFAQRPRVLARTRATSSTTEEPQPLVSDDQSTKATATRLFKRPKPTERTKSSTLQEPPTEKPSPIFRARPVSSGEPTNTQTEYDLSKQIDPPIHEYFPRSGSVSSFTFNWFY